jgi:hypothetical protein
MNFEDDIGIGLALVVVLQLTFVFSDHFQLQEARDEDSRNMLLIPGSIVAKACTVSLIFFVTGMVLNFACGYYLHSPVVGEVMSYIGLLVCKTWHWLGVCVAFGCALAGVSEGQEWIKGWRIKRLEK